VSVLLPSISATIPSYIGVREEDEYIWEIDFDEEVYNRTIDDGYEGDNYFAFFDSIRGLKYRIESINPEIWEGGIHIIPVEISVYITNIDVSELEWILLGAYNHQFVDPNDKQSIAIWVTLIVSRFMNWSLVAQSYKFDLSNDPYISAYLVDGWTHGIMAMIYFKNVSVPIRLSYEYNTDGILIQSIAYYGYDIISTVSLIDQYHEQINGPFISGYLLVVVNLVIFFSVGGLIIKIKKNH